MATDTAISGRRDLRASLDAPTGGDDPHAAESVVVALPPHPQMGGSRSDRRLRAVEAAVTDRGRACCRVDYGPWDGGPGEVVDAVDALAWADERFDGVALFGYSFGAGVAVCAAAERDPSPEGLAVLAPPSSVGEGCDVVDRLSGVDCPVLVCVGSEDRTVDWEPVAERTRDLGHAVEAFPTGHHVGGEASAVADRVADFLAEIGD